MASKFICIDNDIELNSDLSPPRILSSHCPFHHQSCEVVTLVWPRSRFVSNHNHRPRVRAQRTIQLTHFRTHLAHLETTQICVGITRITRVLSKVLWSMEARAARKGQ